MRSSISKNFSPPHASRCSATSSGCCAHSLCAPDGVVIYLGELTYRGDFIRVDMDLLA